MDKKIKKLGTANPSYTDLNDMPDEKLHELREKQIKNLSLIENKLGLKSGDEIKEEKNHFMEGFNKFEMRKWLEDISILFESHFKNIDVKYKEGFAKWVTEGGNSIDSVKELYLLWGDFAYNYIQYLIQTKIKELK